MLKFEPMPVAHEARKKPHNSTISLRTATMVNIFNSIQLTTTAKKRAFMIRVSFNKVILMTKSNEPKPFLNLKKLIDVQCKTVILISAPCIDI